ncbi:uncharacterized protein EAE97_005392 [Botrytis byssoidea]|uniref:Uncharacterized protein n=1 Tax=Botrytis byssoidea TaxID=139641 RepID=A0A9P5LV71_9HELO|nr:uncharacterized protein EAE97_005392 [Botrytis byssoidea]KAF7944759.1 hypothetical protein EAE97_005392 [Botrytis byssoidea]
MVRLTYTTAAIASATAQIPGLFLVIYFSPPHNYPSSSFSDEELLRHKGRRQVSAIMIFLFTFSMTFLSFALRIKDERGNKSEHGDAWKAKTCAELVIVKTALKKEKERVNRIEQVMESLQAQVGVLRARLTVRDAEARNKSTRGQAMEDDRQRQTEILVTRIITQEAKMKEVWERLDENDSCHDAIGVWIEKLKSEGEKTKEELRKFDCVDKEINALYQYLVKEASIIREFANGDLEKFRVDIETFKRCCAEDFRRIHGDRLIRELVLREEIKTEIKNDLRREQEMREDTASRGESSSQRNAEPVETRVNQEVVGNTGGDKKQEADTSAKAKTPIQERKSFLHKALASAIQSSLDQERDAEMKDLEQGKDEAMKDITHELKNRAEVEGEGNNPDEEWTELRY